MPPIPPSGEAQKGESQQGNHPPADFQELKTTNLNAGKNVAIIKIGLIVVIIICAAILLGNIFNIFGGKPSPPNEKLIEYLKEERKEIVAQNAALEKLIIENYKAAIDRQHRDSIADLQQQNRLLQSLQNFKQQYEKNNHILNLDTAELRRAYHDFKP